MAQRTDDQILSLAPLEVQFGTKQYPIPLLRINDSRNWRSQFIEATMMVSDEMKKDAGGIDSFMKGLGFVLVQFPEKVMELVRAYAPGLDWKTIEQEATDEQLAKAFSEIIEIAFPFQGALRKMTAMGAVAATSRQ